MRPAAGSAATHAETFQTLDSGRLIIPDHLPELKAYLRPAAFTREVTDARLAGGAVRFAAVEVILAGGGARRSAHRVLNEELAAVAVRLPPDQQARLDRLWRGLSSAPACLPGGGPALDEPVVMGILNVTPDSFSDGGRWRAVDNAMAAAHAMSEAGAAIIDVGGESTRPGAPPVGEAEELSRVLPVLDALAGSRLRISIDTRRAAVMRAALERGARIVNDVSALTFDPAAADVLASSDCAVVLVHHKGTPATMARAAPYDDPELRVFDWLEARIAAAEASGIARERIIVDPGVGFGEGLAHDLALLNGIGMLHGLGRPVLVGASRKRFLGRLGGDDAPADHRLGGSIAAALAAVGQGAQIVRVHDVEETVQSLRLWQALGARTI